MLDQSFDAENYRRIARELRCLAFQRVAFDLCRKNQLMSLAKGFDRFADRIEDRCNGRSADGSGRAAVAVQPAASGRMTR